VAENGVIGRDNRLPWRLPDDLRRFKRLTLDHPVIMGRRTWESIGRPLPRRRNLVLTGNPGYRAEGVETVPTFEAALAACAGAGEVFVIGGAGVFRAAFPYASRLYLTRVHADMEGDVRFEEEALRGWDLVDEEHHAADADHEYAFTFRTYDRRPLTAPPEVPSQSPDPSPSPREES
jgi:dihydrofolate reductase